jgi:SPP1 family predicted phage head-tail adaptor
LKTCVRQYDKKISVEKMSTTATADAHGFIDPTAGTNWSEYTTAYAKCSSKGGREFWKVDQVHADVSHVWTCPYNATLAAATPDMRLTYDSNTYEILSVVVVDLDNVQIEIQTKRAV